MFDLLHKWVSESPTKYFPFIFALSAFLLKREKRINLLGQWVTTKVI